MNMLTVYLHYYGDNQISKVVEDNKPIDLAYTLGYALPRYPVPAIRYRVEQTDEATYIDDITNHNEPCVWHMLHYSPDYEEEYEAMRQWHCSQF